MRLVHYTRILDVVELGVRILFHVLDPIHFYIVAVSWQLAVRSLRTVWAGGGSLEPYVSFFGIQSPVLIWAFHTCEDDSPAGTSHQSGAAIGQDRCYLVTLSMLGSRALVLNPTPSSGFFFFFLTFLLRSHSIQGGALGLTVQLGDFFFFCTRKHLANSPWTQSVFRTRFLHASAQCPQR